MAGEDDEKTPPTGTSMVPYDPLQDPAVCQGDVQPPLGPEDRRAGSRYNIERSDKYTEHREILDMSPTRAEAEKAMAKSRAEADQSMANSQFAVPARQETIRHAIGVGGFTLVALVAVHYAAQAGPEVLKTTITALAGLAAALGIGRGISRAVKQWKDGKKN